MISAIGRNGNGDDLSDDSTDAAHITIALHDW